MNHDWKVCRCTECQEITQTIEEARAQGATEMRDKILALARQFNVPGMAINVLKALALPEKKFK